MFNTLEEYYIILNEDKLYKEDIILSSNLKVLLNSFDDSDVKKKCSYEIFFQDFHFRRGEYIPLFAFGENCYPTLEQFNDLEYLQKRALDCVNNKYKAKYYQLLYQKTNDKREAIKAIDSFLELLSTTNLNLKDNLEIRGFIDAFDNLIFLSEKVKYKHKEVLQFSKDLILQNKVSDYCLFHIIDFVTNNVKLDTESKQLTILNLERIFCC
jgi:hypothetical protein